MTLGGDLREAELMRNRDPPPPPTGNLNTRWHLKIKKKDAYFKYIYICVFREKYRQGGKVIRLYPV